MLSKYIVVMQFYTKTKWEIKSINIVAQLFFFVWPKFEQNLYLLIWQLSAVIL